MALTLLILGGTTEASALAARLGGDPRFAVTLSLAGRTQAPRLPPVAVRVGGFGGAEGLAAYLTDNAVDVLIDATHPFAEQISANARLAAISAGKRLIALERKPWRPVPGDRWTEVESLAAAAAALPAAQARVFLTVGRQSLALFAERPQHYYLIRVIDPPEVPEALRDVEIVTGRGPFGLEDERALMRERNIDILVTKNSGGKASASKLQAARELGLPVILVRQPSPAAREAMVAHSPEAVIGDLERLHGDLTKRSV